MAPLILGNPRLDTLTFRARLEVWDEGVRFLCKKRNLKRASKDYMQLTAVLPKVRAKVATASFRVGMVGYWLKCVDLLIPEPTLQEDG